jgi:hypothetical protein
MDSFSTLALTAAMIAAFVLLGSGIKLAVGRQNRWRGTLMIGAALVLVMNVMIWTG